MARPRRRNGRRRARAATLLGLLLPWLLGRLGTDPAYGSGPLATSVQDVLSLLVYFACVSVIVL